MKHIPVRIESPNLEFVIVGPHSRQDGILVSSSHLSIDLIGFSNSVYFGSNYVRNTKSINSKYSQYFFAWSGEMVNSQYNANQNIESRPFRLLYCWKNISNSISPPNPDKQREVNEIFHRLGFDIYNLLANQKLNINEVYSSLTWKISPLIFASL